MGNRVSNQQHLYKTLVVGDTPYAILDGDPDFFFVDTTGGDMAVGLPAAASNDTRRITIVKTVAANKVTISGNLGELINGAATQYLFNRYAILASVCDGTEWYIDSGAHSRMRCKFISAETLKGHGANPPADGLEDFFRTKDFDDTVEESLCYAWQLPLDYITSGKVRVAFAFFVDTAPAAAKNIVWGAEHKALSTGDIFDFGAGTATATITEAVITGTPANDKATHLSSDTLFTTTGWTSHDVLLMRFFRKAADAADTFVGDARLAAIHIEYEADESGNEN